MTLHFEFGRFNRITFVIGRSAVATERYNNQEIPDEVATLPTHPNAFPRLKIRIYGLSGWYVEESSPPK